MKLKLINTLLCLGLCSLAYAQNIGDFVSVNSGSWNDNANWGIWNGTNATSTLTTPNSGKNVVIAKGHTIKLEKDEFITNLTISTGGALISDGLGIKRLVLGAGLGNKIASYLINEGVLGGDIGDDLISIEIQNSVNLSPNGPFLPKTSFTISGKGKTNVAAFIAAGMGPKETNIKNLDININTPLNLSGNKSRTFTLCKLGGNSEYENYVMNINSPVILTGTEGSFNMSANTAITGGTYTYNLNSILDFSNSSLSHGFIPLINAKSKFELHVNKGGTYIMGPKLAIVNIIPSPDGTYGTATMTIEDGGKVIASKIRNLPANAFLLKGTGLLVK